MSWPRFVRDELPAIVLGTLVLVEVAANDGSPATAIGGLAVSGLVAMRRRQPLITPVVAGGVLVVQSASGGSAHTDVFAVVVALLLLSYATSALQPRRPALLGGGAVLLGLLVAIAVDGDVFDAVLAAVVMSAPWLAGRTAYRLHGLTEDLARERDRSAHDAVLAERSRIARDLHDVVAHSVSLMVVQAGGARGVLQQTGGNEQAITALAAIEQTGRSALVEMRRLLGLLRDETDELTSRPGIDSIAELAAEGVILEVAGEPVTVPGGVDVAAYRVVQEALTNARRHGLPGPVVVRLEWLPDSLRILVDSPGSSSDAQAGHGIVGMRERVAMYGGSLEASPRGDGWRVDASIPLADA